MPQRMSRILARLSEEADADRMQWERGAPFDSYAIDVATVRFRIRSENATGEPPYVLEFLREGSTVPPIVTGEAIDSPQAELLQRLYNAARSNATRHTPDPFDAVERELGPAPAPDTTP